MTQLEEELMRTQLVTGVLGLALVAAGVGLAFGVAFGLIAGGVGLVTVAFLTTPAAGE